jgi:hypothetical protein
MYNLPRGDLLANLCDEIAQGGFTAPSSENFTPSCIQTRLHAGTKVFEKQEKPDF